MQCRENLRIASCEILWKRLNARTRAGVALAGGVGWCNVRNNNVLHSFDCLCKAHTRTFHFNTLCGWGSNRLQTNLVRLHI